MTGWYPAQGGPAELGALAEVLRERYELTAFCEDSAGSYRLLVASPRFASARVLSARGWFWWGWGEGIALIEELEVAAKSIATRLAAHMDDGVLDLTGRER